MKINIANPATGAQKLLDFDHEKYYRVFYEKRIAQEVPADSLGDEWKGYVFRITGGNDIADVASADEDRPTNDQA